MDEKKTDLSFKKYVFFQFSQRYVLQKKMKVLCLLSKNHQISIVKTPETAILIERMKEREFNVEIFLIILYKGNYFG